jgi:phenylpropionate dioxygenase-like ring-hydroxylating dioxygenase large terminal subunit
VFRADAYPTYEAHDFIWVWWGEEPGAGLEPPRFFDDIDDTFTHRTLSDPWDAHYTRVIENQLDVAHLPFVHGNSIGRGNRTLVDGPILQWIDDDLFYVYTRNRTDDGAPPKKPSEVAVPDLARENKLEFLFPNLWQNYIQADMRVVGAFVPVDEEHTLLYLRFYQRFIRFPILRNLVVWLALPANRYIAHQDRRVVITQEPKASGLRIGEKLIQADRPIVEYRRRREALLESARQNLAQDRSR